MNLLSPETLTAVIQGILGSIATFLLAIAIQWSYRSIQVRNIRRFWQPFMGTALTIIMAEYPEEGDDFLARIAKTAGTGRLISKGMALAMATLLDFCEKRVTKGRDLDVCGDKSGLLTTDNLIALGSPASNLFTRSMFNHLQGVFEIPFQIVWNEDGSSIEIVANTGERFSPKVENGFGEDYALVGSPTYNRGHSHHCLISS